mgnify:FL=1
MFCDLRHSGFHSTTHVGRVQKYYGQHLWNIRCIGYVQDRSGRDNDSVVRKGLRKTKRKWHLKTYRNSAWWVLRASGITHVLSLGRVFSGPVHSYWGVVFWIDAVEPSRIYRLTRRGRRVCSFQYIPGLDRP